MSERVWLTPDDVTLRDIVTLKLAIVMSGSKQCDVMSRTHLLSFPLRSLVTPSVRKRQQTKSFHRLNPLKSLSLLLRLHSLCLFLHRRQRLFPRLPTLQMLSRENWVRQNQSSNHCNTHFLLPLCQEKSESSSPSFGLKWHQPEVTWYNIFSKGPLGHWSRIFDFSNLISEYFL